MSECSTLYKRVSYHEDKIAYIAYNLLKYNILKDLEGLGELTGGKLFKDVSYRVFTYVSVVINPTKHLTI